MKSWAIFELNGGLGSHAKAWDGLHQQLFRSNPLLDSRFVDALLRCFGTGKERLCILHHDGAVTAMCVMQKRSPGLWTSFLPSQTQIGPTLLTSLDAVPELLSALPGINGQADFLCNDPDFGDLTHDHQGPSQHHALTMSIHLVGGFNNYWSARSKKLVQNVARYDRRTQADGLLRRFVCVADAAEVSAAVARYATLESRGWKGKLGTAVSVNNIQGAFYDDISTRFAQTGQTSVYELWFGENLVAARLAIVMAGTVVMLKTAYDEDFEKYAPGRLLLRDAIQHAFESYEGGIIEFYTNASSDQLAWATHQRWIMHVSCYRNEIWAKALELIRTVRYVLRRNTLPAAADRHMVTVYQHPREFPPEVLQLFDRAEKESVEYGSTWFINLVDNVYTDHPGVRFYVLWLQGVAVAAMPILVNADKRGTHIQSLSNYYTAIYTPLIAKDLKARELAPLIRVIRRDHVNLVSMKFAPMDPDSASYRKLLEALKIAGLLPFEYFCFGNWFFKTKGTWVDYLNGRDGALRNTVKRMTKKFVASGGRLELVQGGPKLERGIKAYEEVYAASWKSAEPFANFMPGLIRACSERGWLRLGIAWLDDVPIAAQLWIVSSGKANIYKLAYHKDYKTYAPGTLLTAMMMQHVFANDAATEVDYLIGDDPYKKSWMDNRRERWGMIAYNPFSIRGFAGQIREVGRAVMQSKLLRFKRQDANAVALSEFRSTAGRAD